MSYFSYGETETDYLKAHDKRLGAVIDAVGPIRRQTDPDLFSSVVHQIIGQQISTKAQAIIWQRMQDTLGAVTPETVSSADTAILQSCGMTFRKVDYIRDLAGRVLGGTFDPEAVRKASDAEAIRQLTSLRGVGVWTAEMILLFCLERPDVLSYSDLAIQRGLCSLYHHRSITRSLFERYRARYSPYGSVASLYLWEVAGGAVPDL